MDKITLGQVLATVTFIVALIGGITALKNTIVKAINKTLEPINKKIDSFELNSIKTDLVNFMAFAENGQVSHEQVKNAYELFDRYYKLGGNSYIHDQWDKLKKEGKI
jgi:hypothetical protein